MISEISKEIEVPRNKIIIVTKENRDGSIMQSRSAEKSVKSLGKWIWLTQLSSKVNTISNPTSYLNEIQKRENLKKWISKVLALASAYWTCTNNQPQTSLLHTFSTTSNDLFSVYLVFNYWPSEDYQGYAEIEGSILNLISTSRVLHLNIAKNYLVSTEYWPSHAAFKKYHITVTSRVFLYYSFN